MLNLLYSINIYAKAKLGIGLPIPLKNHFYKGEKLHFKKHWFCKNCYCTFNLNNWRKIKNQPIDQLQCPTCNSKSIYHSNLLSKAIIDKKETYYLLQIINAK